MLLKLHVTKKLMWRKSMLLSYERIPHIMGSYDRVLECNDAQNYGCLADTDYRQINIIINVLIRLLFKTPNLNCACSLSSNHIKAVFVMPKFPVEYYYFVQCQMDVVSRILCA